MFGLGRSNNSVRYGALFDVGSESVGVALVVSHAGDTYPTILFSHRVHMRITVGESTAHDRLRQMREALFSASLILSRDGLEALRLHDTAARVSEVLLTVSAPWAHTISRNVVYKGETELKITRALIDELIKSAEDEISADIGKLYGEHKDGFRVVEKATVDVRINDYPVTSPIGLKGKEVSLVHVTGLVPEDILKAVDDVQAKVLPSTRLRTHTFLLTLFCVIRERIKDHASLTIVHVTGETTEFGIVENSTLTESISVPFGLNSIVRDIIQKSGQTAKEVHSLLTLYHAGELSDAESKRVETILDTYRANVASTLHGFALTKRFPQSVFLLAPASFTPLFKKILEPTLQAEIAATGEIGTIPKDDIGSTPLHDADDDHLTVSSHFFHKLHTCGEIEAP